jgi:inner membrane protein
MDNFTHTLIGVALGQGLGSEERGDVRAQVVVAALASNAPDLDVVLEPMLGEGKLGYLLHHRGYTHTVLALLPLALLSAVLGARLAGKGSPSWTALLPAAGLGVALHLVADGCNDYGVHPLSPVLDRWYHGDTLFIVEPLVLLALLPMAFLRSGSPIVRGVWAAVGGLLLLVGFALPQIRWPTAVWTLAWAAAMALWQRRRRSLAVPVGAALAVVLAFAVGSARARWLVRGAAAGSERTLDVVLTPAPANPLCFRVLWVGLDGPTYVARKGAISLFPSVIDPGRCSFGRGGPGTAPLSPAGQKTEQQAGRAAAGLRWEGEFRAPLAGLQALVAEDCRAGAAIRFLRAPFWAPVAGGMVLGDLRYDNEAGLGFAELLIPAGERGSSAACPSLVPPWEPPLARAGVALFPWADRARLRGVAGVVA